jgi:hypothetical protein
VPIDGAAEFSRMTGVPRAEILSMWDQVKINIAKLDACPRHRFEPVPVRMGDKVRCDNCGGQISLVDLSHYVKGYRAAGGDVNDVWPGYDTRRSA